MFEEWAEGLGCGKEPLEGKLFIHTAWVGPLDSTLHNKSSVRRDVEALLDSFLMTQNLETTIFHFWWLNREPGALDDPIVKAYSKYPSIQFRTADIDAMAKGTPIEGMESVLAMGKGIKVSNKSKRPRQLANMFRMLALYKLGGVWIDTDTLILRDMRPLLEYSGEFATQLSISKYYNNNFMGLRAGSALGWFFLDIIAKTDLPPTPAPGMLAKNVWPAKYCRYVTRSGGDCYEIWYWNHGSIQLAVYEKRGIVTFPTIFSDPGYQSCYAPYLMGYHGGLTMRGLNITEELELLRGSFIIHTRAYNANKPLGVRSNFHRLYLLFRAGAEKGLSQSVPAMPLGRRTPAEEEHYSLIWAKRMTLTGDVNKFNVVEPPWYPRGPRQRVQVLLTNTLGGSSPVCMGYFMKEMKDLGMNFPVGTFPSCSSRMWAWNPGTVPGEGGYLRPWIRTPKKVLCMDGNPKSAYGRRAPAGVQVATVVCNPTRRSQKWLHALGRLINMESKLCLHAPEAAMQADAGEMDGMRLVPCTSVPAG